MGKILRMLGAALAYFALGTILAEAVGLYLFWSQGKLAPERLWKALAALEGIELPDADAPKPEPPPQPTLEDVAAARAVKLRQIEQRELALAEGLQLLREERDRLSAQAADVARQQQAFAAELEELHNAALESGRENARLILENIKPKQAKELLVRMLDDGELDDVVMLVAQMPQTKRAKIAGEFKTDAEQAQLNEIMRKIREGAPDAPLAEQALETAQEEDAETDEEQ